MKGDEPSRHALVERLVEQHSQIKELLGRIDLALATRSGTLDEACEELINVLWAHNALEEGSAYPWLDGHLTEIEVQTLKRRLEEKPAPGSSSES